MLKELTVFCLMVFQYDHLNDLRQKFDSNSERQDALRGQYSTQALEDNLKVATHQAEEQAEHVAEQFLSGESTELVSK